MGYWNAQQAFRFAAEHSLNHRAARLFVWMGLETLDEVGRDGAPPRRYYAGREHMAIGVGYIGEAVNSAGAQGVVKQAVNELRRAGAIDLVRAAGASGRPSVYDLLLDAKPAVLRPPAAERRAS